MNVKVLSDPLLIMNHNLIIARHEAFKSGDLDTYRELDWSLQILKEIEDSKMTSIVDNFNKREK